MNIKSLTLVFCCLNAFLFNSNTSADQNQLCEHKTDGSGKSKGLIIGMQLPCDWTELENKASEAVFKFAKKNYEIKVSTTSDLYISDLPNGLNSSQEEELLKPEGLKTLSEGSGEIVSSKPLKINNLNGGQIIRKDADHNFIKVRNYFIFKRKLITISYFLISSEEINIKDYLNNFDTYLAKTTFN